MTVCALSFISLYYATALKYKFIRAYEFLTPYTIFLYIVPISFIIVGSEMLREVLIAQNSKVSSVFAYLICVITEVVCFFGFAGIRTFNNFMDLLGQRFLPAIIVNILFNYVSKRYGAKPNIFYRLIVTVLPIVISYESAIPDSLFAIAKLIFPLIVYWFIDSMYERKKRYALKKRGKLSLIGTVCFGVIIVLYVMLISCQFTFGMIVIGSESMTGEINKGDALIYKEYDDEILTKGTVIVFQKDGSRIVHRIVNIERVNGQNRYYTKGDFNEEDDDGYVTDAQIVGVAKFKIPYVGYPTLWIRSLFS